MSNWPVIVLWLSVGGMVLVGVLVWCALLLASDVDDAMEDYDELERLYEESW